MRTHSRILWSRLFRRCAAFFLATLAVWALLAGTGWGLAAGSLDALTSSPLFVSAAPPGRAGECGDWNHDGRAGLLAASGGGSVGAAAQGAGIDDTDPLAAQPTPSAAPAPSATPPGGGRATRSHRRARGHCGAHPGPHPAPTDMPMPTACISITGPTCPSIWLRPPRPHQGPAPQQGPQILIIYIPMPPRPTLRTAATSTPLVTRIPVPWTKLQYDPGGK